MIEVEFPLYLRYQVSQHHDEPHEVCNSTTDPSSTQQTSAAWPNAAESICLRIGGFWSMRRTLYISYLYGALGG